METLGLPEESTGDPKSFAGVRRYPSYLPLPTPTTHQTLGPLPSYPHDPRPDDPPVRHPTRMVPNVRTNRTDW